MTVRECYDSIGGDYLDIWNRIPKDDLILKFLKKYAAGKDFDAMLDAYERKDYQKLFETSHSIKGITLNLSLVKINQIITKICEAVRNGEPDMDLTELIELAKNEQHMIIEKISQLEVNDC